MTNVERPEEQNDVLAVLEALAEYQRGETISLEQLVVELEQADSDTRD